MAEPDLQDAPLGVEAQRGKEVWAGTVAAADGEPAWAAFAQCWTSGRVGRLWATTGAAPFGVCWNMLQTTLLSACAAGGCGRACSPAVPATSVTGPTLHLVLKQSKWGSPVQLCSLKPCLPTPCPV